MEKVNIKTHSFEDAKLAIKQFAEQTNSDLELMRVKEKKEVLEWLGDFVLGSGIKTDHYVNGEELNDLTLQIQKHLQSIKTIQIDQNKIFGQVYTALESLDKEYIQAILVNQSSLEEASESIGVNQNRIEKLVNDQKKIITNLNKFKQKLDSYAHLEDIDKIWNDCQKLNQDMTELSSFISEAIEIGENNTKKINEMEHLMQVQDEQHSKCLDTQKKYIESIMPHVAETEDTDLLLKKLNKKIQYTYWIAGGSMMLVLVEFFLLLLR